MITKEFTPTHEFHLLDGTIVYVVAELRGDWIAFETDGTSWYTVCGDLHPQWSCSARGVSRVRNVVKYGHRYCTVSRGKSYRFECECEARGSWVRSDESAADRGAAHHRDAVRLSTAPEPSCTCDEPPYTGHQLWCAALHGRPEYRPREELDKRPLS